MTACWQAHWHGFNETALDNIKYIISGGGGANFHPPILERTPNRFNDRHHFMVVDVYEDGQVHVDVGFSDEDPNDNLDYGFYL